VTAGVELSLGRKDKAPLIKREMAWYFDTFGGALKFICRLLRRSGSQGLVIQRAACAIAPGSSVSSARLGRRARC
jgi:hypothetical protein